MNELNNISEIMYKIHVSDIYKTYNAFILNILFTHNINTYPQISILVDEAAYNHLQQRHILLVA